MWLPTSAQYSRNLRCEFGRSKACRIIIAERSLPRSSKLRLSQTVGCMAAVAARIILAGGYARIDRKEHQDSHARFKGLPFDGSASRRCGCFENVSAALMSSCRSLRRQRRRQDARTAKRTTVGATTSTATLPMSTIE